MIGPVSQPGCFYNVFLLPMPWLRPANESGRISSTAVGSGLARRELDAMEIFARATEFAGSPPTVKAKSLLALSLVQMLFAIEKQLASIASESKSSSPV